MEDAIAKLGKRDPQGHSQDPLPLQNKLDTTTLSALCELCGRVDSGISYKCPGCWVRMCGVQCGKEHKEKCDKSKAPYSYKKMSDMDKQTLNRDFNFLSTLMVDADKVGALILIV